MQPTIEYVIYSTQNHASPLDYLPSLLSAIAAIISALIGAWALRFSNKQQTTQDSHNKLMVKPFLDSSNHIDIHNQTYKYEISNNGIGPAIIKDIKILIDGEIIIAEDIVERMIKRLIPNIADVDFGHHNLAINSYLPAGQKVFLFTITKNSHFKAEDFGKTLNKSCEISIQYESIYGDKFTFNARD